MRSALVLLVALTACKSAEREAPQPATVPKQVEPSKTTPVAIDLPPEAPLDQVLALPPEATPEMIERRLDRALELLDALFETIVEHANDCDRMATSLERFVEVNRVMIEQVKGLEDRKELLEGKFKPKLDAWIQKWMPRLTNSLSTCFSDPRVMKVFQSFDDK